MPSDPRLPLALGALAQPIAEFRAVVDGAIAQADAYLASQRATTPERAERAAASLGRFGAGRIDASAFAALFPPVAAAAPPALAALERALATLHGVRARGDELFVVDVAPNVVANLGVYEPSARMAPGSARERT